MNDLSFPQPSMTAKAIFEGQVAAIRTDRASVFSLRAQMLE